MISAEKRTKKFYAAVNAVVCKLPHTTREEDIRKSLRYPVISSFELWWSLVRSYEHICMPFAAYCLEKGHP